LSKCVGLELTNIVIDSYTHASTRFKPKTRTRIDTLLFIFEIGESKVGMIIFDPTRKLDTNQT
jgi:hypothetical protein